MYRALLDRSVIGGRAGDRDCSNKLIIAELSKTIEKKCASVFQTEVLAILERGQPARRYKHQ